MSEISEVKKIHDELQIYEAELDRIGIPYKVSSQTEKKSILDSILFISSKVTKCYFKLTDLAKKIGQMSGCVEDYQTGGQGLINPSLSVDMLENLKKEILEYKSTMDFYDQCAQACTSKYQKAQEIIVDDDGDKQKSYGQYTKHYYEEPKIVSESRGHNK